VSYSGFAYSETESNLSAPVTASTNADTDSPAGTYQIIPSGAISENYIFNYVNGTLTITPAIPSISIDNVTKTYGDISFTMEAISNSTGTITYSILSGTAASITSSGVVTILGAGTVTIRASQTARGSYAAGAQNVSLTINPKSLTISVENTTRPYGQANPDFTINYSGFAYNETSVDLTTLASASTLAEINSTIGDYTINIDGAQSTNYTFNYVSGTLTIVPADASSSSSFSNTNTGKEGTVIDLTITSPSGGAVTYSITNGSGTASLTDNQLTLISQGTIIVTATIAANGNYSETIITQEVTITAVTSVNTLNDASDWKFYPVPAREMLTFQISLTKASLVIIELVEVETGRVMHTSKTNFSSGDQMMQILVSELTEGIYVAKIYVNDQIAYKKLSIVK
jgi:hypothetical protein